MIIFLFKYMFNNHQDSLCFCSSHFRSCWYFKTHPPCFSTMIHVDSEKGWLLWYVCLLSRWTRNQPFVSLWVPNVWVGIVLCSWHRKIKCWHEEWNTIWLAFSNSFRYVLGGVTWGDDPTWLRFLTAVGVHVKCRRCKSWKRSKMVEVIWNLKINSQMSVVNLVATESARSKPSFSLVCSRFGCDLSSKIDVFRFKVDVFLPKIMPHLIHPWFGAGDKYRLLVHQRSKQAWYSSGALSIVIGIGCLVAWLPGFFWRNKPIENLWT